MSTSLFDEPTVRPSTSPAQRLRVSTAAVRLAISWLGVRKTLTTDQKNQAAEGFGHRATFFPPVRNCWIRPIRPSRRSQP